MTRWILEDRERALEEAFFKNKEDKLLREQRASADQQEMRKKLAQIVESAAGSKNEELIEHLIHIGIRPETWAAVALIPLIEVAWSDGAVEEEEVEAILDPAHANGIKKGTPTHALLEGWLKERPSEEFSQTWVDYMKALSLRVPYEKWIHLRDDILERTMLIAESAGGLLGLGSLTDGEEETIAKIEAVFTVTAPNEAKSKFKDED